MANGTQPIRHDSGRSDAAASPEPAKPDQMTPLRELQLVEAIRAGGSQAREALSELIRGYQRRIYSICLRMVRNPEDASDLTQDALIKLIEGLGSYNGQSKLSTWVIRVTINCCLSFLRRQKVRMHESLDGSQVGGGLNAGTRRQVTNRHSEAESPGFGPASGARELTPPQRIEQEQTRAMILQALDSLDADTRAILVLRDMQDLDYQQLAEVLDVPIGTVKSRLFRARAALREAIEARLDA